MAEDLISGNLPPADILHLLQPETMQLLCTISTRNTQQAHPSVDIEISIKAFQSCYKAVRESTSSSPSGRHVGHYKAAATMTAYQAYMP